MPLSLDVLLVLLQALKKLSGIGDNIMNRLGYFQICRSIAKNEENDYQVNIVEN